MNENTSITTHDQYADDFDRLVNAYGSHAAEILFGLCFEFVQPGKRLLDIGIGTGLSSQDFAKAGLEIYGIDGSAAMLDVCRNKGFAHELTEWDLTKTPWPYADRACDYALACGLFHFFGDLTASIHEVTRLLNREGIFAFTVMSRSGLDAGEVVPGTYSDIMRGGVPGAAHSAGYIDALLEGSGFILLKRARFLLWSGEENLDDEFTAYVFRKNNSDQSSKTG